MTRKKCPSGDCDCESLRRRVDALERQVGQINRRIDQVRNQLSAMIRAVERALKKEIADTFRKVRAEIDALGKALRNLIETVRRALLTKINQVLNQLRAEIAALGKTLRDWVEKFFLGGGGKVQLDVIQRQLAAIGNVLTQVRSLADTAARKSNDAAYAATQTSNKIGSIEKKANDAAYAAAQASSKISSAERNILATLAVMSVAIAGVSAAAAAAVSKAFSLTFAGLSGLVQAAIAQLKILTAGFTAMQTSLNAIQNSLAGISNLINRLEKAIDGVLKQLNRVALDVNYIVKLSENIFQYCQFLDRKFTSYVTDLRADNTRAFNLINGTRQLLESRIQGVISLLRTRVSGNFTLPTPTGGTINFPFVGEGFDGLKSGVEQLGSGLSRILNRAYDQKIIDVFKFNAQVAQKNQDGDWENITKEITSLKVGADGLHIFDSQVITDLQELKKKDCGGEAIAAVPEWWQVRAGADRPQLILQFGEDLGNGKIGPAKYVLTIPYAENTPLTNPPIPQWQKGEWMGIQILPDNSKIIVNCSSMAEAERVLDLALALVEPALRYGSTRHLGRRRGQALRSITVKARIATYFATGQRDTVPDWRVYF